MQRTAGGIRADATTRLAELERSRPEWGTWLAMLVASHGSRVAGRVGGRQSRVEGGVATEPLLHECTIEVDSAEASRLLRRLVSIAAESDLAGAATLRHYRPSTVESVELLLAAIKQDQDQLASVAERAGVDPRALASIAHLAALPLLRSCRETLEDQVPSYWPHGYCPICAAWPTLAERRGLDRSRRLRCGRCAAEWEAEPLWCVYCGEREHRVLGVLMPEGSGERLKIDTCDSCRGYLKSVATLQAIPSFELLLQDLETVELDLVARERGYGRPEGTGFRLVLSH